MSARDWGTPPTVALSVLISAIQTPYVLLAGFATRTPVWAQVMGVSFPVSALAAFLWYVRRYSPHRDRDLLFRYAGQGSVLGGAVLATVGLVIVFQQQAVGLPILNPDVLIIELWLGGSLIGLAGGHLYAETRARQTRLTRILEATQGIILGDGVAATAERTVTAAEGILGLETSAIYTPGGDGTLVPVAATERTADIFGEVPAIESRDAIAWSVYDDGDPVFADDVRDHPDVYNPETPVRSEMLLPIGDFGVFMAASTEVNDFDETDRVMARVLISNAKAALGRATNEAELREREAKLEGLQERSQRLISATTKEETARVAVSAAEDVIGLPLSGVHRLNEAGDTLQGSVMTEAAREAFDGLPDYHRDHDDGSSDAIVWEVFERGESLYIEDTHEYDQLTEEPLSRCLLAHPVGDHGVFIASSEQPNRFDEIDQTLFELLASTLTTAFDRVEREQTLRRREERLQQHQQRFTVLNRVLRHDIRTQVNVILGGVSQLAESIGDTPALGSIKSRSLKIVELSENARRIEETISDSNDATFTVNLNDIIEECIENIRANDSEFDAETEIPDDIYVSSNGLLDAAVENVLMNAVEHNDRNPPEIDLTVSREPDDGGVAIRVADNGPGIPANERHVFEQGDETQLQHSSGLGLWLVHWIINDLDGTVEIEDRQPRGTVVRLRLPHSPADDSTSESPSPG